MIFFIPNQKYYPKITSYSLHKKHCRIGLMRQSIFTIFGVTGLCETVESFSFGVYNSSQIQQLLNSPERPPTLSFCPPVSVSLSGSISLASVKCRFQKSAGEQVAGILGDVLGQITSPFIPIGRGKSFKHQHAAF